MTDYIQQVVDIAKDWQNRGLCVDTSPANEVKQLQTARANAVQNYCISEQEFGLIMHCRLYSNLNLLLRLGDLRWQIILAFLNE